MMWQRSFSAADPLYLLLLPKYSYVKYVLTVIVIDSHLLYYNIYYTYTHCDY